MDRFAEVADQYDPHAVEERVFEYWDEVDAYEKTKEHRSDGEEFFFVDGPPYTSGAAHMGTTWNKTLKDAYVRFLRMQGYDVTDRPGYDMHGLPIETRVEERLGFENKKDIEEYGEEAFIEECKAYAEEQLEGLQEDFQSFGVWLDWENPYKTVDPSYMEGAWWGFSRANDRGLVEQGDRSITQCPRCETAIAKNEVEFEVVEDPSIYVKLPLSDREGYLVVWTTTPWTIPGNTFVAVGGDLTYQAVRAEKDGTSEVLYVAEPCVEGTLKAGRYDDYEVLDEFTGEEMVGWSYDHPFGDSVDHPGGDGAFEVYTAEYVEADRTGLVHSAPGHGEEDFERGTELGLPTFCPVGGDGTFDERAGPYAGEFVRDANDDVIADLEDRGLMLAADTVEHDYGHCWRCDTGIVQIVTDQWFITITDIKDELLANVEDSEWHPEWARDNRFRDFVEDAPDWNVSRQRYWGIPIPIWTPEDWSGDMDDAIVVGTREELAERVDQDVDPETVDLHKGTVDDLTITEDATTYTRVPDVFDVWLDSSVATWGTLDYPEREEDFEKQWPADLIMEAHDQTRGWFWSQLGMGTAALGEIPYEEVLMHGFALMPDGRAMSKSKDILVDPKEVIEEYGTDPMRLFLLSVSAQGEDMRFSYEETAEMARRLNILWNVFRFPLPYMRMDGFKPELPAFAGGDGADGVSIDDVSLELEDEWVLSRLQAVKEAMAEAWEAFEHDKAVDALLSFVVDDLSRYYVQLVRERMWEEEDSESKRAAYATTHRVLLEVVALLAPYAPFVTEKLYGHLTGDVGFDTVHMSDWPTPDESRRQPALEDAVETVRAVEEAGSNARQQAGRKLRWPVQRVVVDADADRVADHVHEYADLVADRLNARDVVVVEPGDEWAELAYSARADMSELGPAFGDDANDVMEALNASEVAEPSLPALRDAVADRLGCEVELTDDMVEFVRETPDEVAGAEFDGGVVYVDATLTEDIESEGYAREIIRRVQEMRKEMDLDVDRRIRLDVMVFDDRVAELVSRREDLVAEEVRAAELGEVEDGYQESWDVEGVHVELAIRPLPEAAA
jgi:isoleucyl-tRNA synthetase